MANMHNRQLIPLSQDIFHINFCLSKRQIIHKIRNKKYQQNISMLEMKEFQRTFVLWGEKLVYKPKMKPNFSKNFKNKF